MIAAGETLAARYGTLLVEGAGGAAVPLTENALVVDLIAQLRMPAIIVSRSTLGTVNHTLLTAEYLKRRNISVVGVILNDSSIQESDNDPSIAMNAALIEQFSDLQVLGRFPHLVDHDQPEALIQAALRSINFAPIRQALNCECNELDG